MEKRLPFRDSPSFISFGRNVSASSVVPAFLTTPIPRNLPARRQPPGSPSGPLPDPPVEIEASGEEAWCRKFVISEVEASFSFCSEWTFVNKIFSIFIPQSRLASFNKPKATNLNVMRQKEDYLFKGILEEIFDDFLRFLQPDAENIFDFSKGIIFMDKELQQLFPPENERYSPKIVDKLAKVFTRDGKEEWILIHVEVQNRYHEDFGRRMLTYYYRILDKYNKPIAAYAILTEGNGIDRPDTFKLEYLGTSLIYRFNSYKIALQNDRELLASNNPFAVVALTVKAALAGKEIKDSKQRDELLLKLKLQLVHELLHKQIPTDKIRVLMNFLRYYVRFENTETNVTFDKEIEKLSERSVTMGIEELLLEKARHDGLKEGLQKRIEKDKQIVRNLIVKHGWADEQIADVAEVSVDFVRKVRASLKKQK